MPVDSRVSVAANPLHAACDGADDPWLRFLPFDDSAVMRAPEMILDGVMGTGSVVLTGDRGAGKPTLGATIAMLVTHLCPLDHPLRPSLRRNVIYVCEDPAQIQLIVRALLRRWGRAGRFTSAEISERIKFVAATPRQAATLEQFGDTVRAMTVRNVTPRDAPPFDAEPLVILDTRSACIAVDDESANAEASAAMAYLRSFVRSVLMISHPPKGNAKTTRGASAWEADAQQVIYLSLDATTRVRTVHLAPDAEREAKRRFESPIESLVVASDVVTFEALDPLGQTVELRVRYCDAMPERNGEKAARQDDEQITQALAAVRRGAVNATQVQESMAIKRARAQELVRLAIEQGLLTRPAVPSGSRSSELQLTPLGAGKLDR